MTMPPNLYQRFQAAPLELRAYAIFSVMATLLGYGLPLIGPRRLWEALVPLVGWTPCLGYVFGLYFTFALIYTTFPRYRLLLGVLAPLALQIAVGLSDLAKPPTPNFGNPFLTVSPWRPVWSIVVPAVWITILLSPRITRSGK